MRAIEIGAIVQWRHYQPNSPSFSPISRPRLAANRKEPPSPHCHLGPLPSWPHHHQNFRQIAAISAFDRLPDFRNFFKDLMKTAAKNLSNPLLLGNNQDSNSGERTQMLTLS